MKKFPKRYSRAKRKQLRAEEVAYQRLMYAFSRACSLVSADIVEMVTRESFIHELLRPIVQDCPKSFVSGA